MAKNRYTVNMQAQMETKTKTPRAYLLLALTALIVIRVLPILKSPLSTYGYDFGFYFDAANQAGQFHLADIFYNAIWGGYNNPLFLLGHTLHLPPSILINELYFLAAILLGLAGYFWMKTKNQLAGIFTCYLIACSFVQTSGYLMYLWKNIVALPILLLGFKFLEEKKYFYLVLCALAILVLHRTTAIVFILALMIYGILELIRQKKFRLLMGLASAALIIGLSGFYFLHLKSIILNLIYNNNYYVTTGLFMEGTNFFWVWWPFLLLVLPGLYIYLKKRQHPILPIFTAILVVWIVFKFPFYRRLLLYLDICILAYGAYFLSLVDYSKRYFKVALGIIIAVLFLRSANYALSQTPLISAQDANEIKTFNYPKGFILAVSADDAPWLLAYAQNYRLGAPGLLEDPHTYQQWKDFWQGQNQRSFLSYYPRPLYIYQRSYRLPAFNAGACLTPLTPNFFQLDYKCLESQSN